MWNEEKIREYLKINLKKNRFEHSLSVMETSIMLSKKYDEDLFKAKMAGLLHDCAKNMSDEEILNLIKSHGFKADEIFLKCPQLMHGKAASIIAEELMDVRDKDILSAIEYHTTGKKNMSKLEKIIYIADYIEPLRQFQGVEKLREAAQINLDEALLSSFDMTIKFVIDKGQLLHLNTVEGRNYLILNMS